MFKSFCWTLWSHCWVARVFSIQILPPPTAQYKFLVRWNTNIFPVISFLCLRDVFKNQTDQSLLSNSCLLSHQDIFVAQFLKTFFYIFRQMFWFKVLYVLLEIYKKKHATVKEKMTSADDGDNACTYHNRLIREGRPVNC